MKSIKQTLFFMAMACVFLCCKKSNEEEEDCEDTRMITVTYTNTGTVALRVEVSQSLTPQYKPINPIVTLDLAPGASVVKEFVAERYFNVWSRGCATTCTMVTYYQKTYTTCSSYEEKQGI